MKITGYHIQGDTAVNSDGDTTKGDVLQFLLNDKPEGLKVFYNLDWAVARLIYLMNLPRGVVSKFWNTGRLYWQGYELFFVPHRYLGIKYGKHWGETAYADIFQYDSNLPFEIDALEAAKRAAEIGQEVYEAMQLIGLEPSTLSSPVSAFQKQFLSTLDLPTWEDCPEEVLIYANRCLRGGWQECFKKGRYQAWDYDITSAYSYFTGRLIDFRYGTWRKVRQYYPMAPIGFYRGTVNITKHFSPIIYETAGQQLTPIGPWDDEYLTSQEIKHIYDYDRGQFKIADGWIWIPDKIVRPLENYINILFDWKQYLKGLKRDVIKRILVGTWGKMAEIYFNGDFGKLYNPVWAACIEPGPRLEVSKFIIENQAEENVLTIAVDGCMLNKEVPVNNSAALGGWRLNKTGQAIVVSSGVSCLEGKKGNGAFSLNYDWLTTQIATDPDADRYTMTKQTPVTIGNALKNDKLDRLGELETEERAVLIGYETKRFFFGRPRNGRDLMENKYDSAALDTGAALATRLINL